MLKLCWSWHVFRASRLAALEWGQLWPWSHGAWAPGLCPAGPAHHYGCLQPNPGPLPHDSWVWPWSGNAGSWGGPGAGAEGHFVARGCSRGRRGHLGAGSTVCPPGRSPSTGGSSHPYSPPPGSRAACRRPMSRRSMDLQRWGCREGGTLAHGKWTLKREWKGQVPIASSSQPPHC